MSLMAILELYTGLKCRKSFKKSFFSLINIEDKLFDHFELKYEKNFFFTRSALTPLERSCP